MARSAPHAAACGAGADLPRPALPGKSLAHHGLARPRPDQPRRPRLRRVRGLARPEAGRGRNRPAQARPQDRARGALDALWRDGAPQAQRAPRRRIAGAAAGAARLSPGRRQGGDRRHRGRDVRRARHRGQGHRQSLRRAADRQGSLPARDARRPHRHRRPQRQRQDHAGRPSHRHARPRQRHGAARRQSRHGRRSTRAAKASIPTGRSARP